MTAVLVLLAFGAVMVFSATSGTLTLQHRSPMGYLLRYGLSAGLGLIAMAFTTRLSVRRLQRMTRPLLFSALVMLVLVLAPGLGHQVNGARRWLGVSALQLQPSEVMKAALVLYAALLLAKRSERLAKRSAARPLLVISTLSCGLIILEPDLGTALVIASAIGCMLWVAGVPARRLLLYLAVAAALVGVMALAQPYAMARLTSFLNPLQHASTSGFQAVQGQIALGSGGLFGRGIGQSVQKLGYLPAAPTDFILAVIGEETGAAGICALLLLYAMLTLTGLRIARRARDPYQQLLAVGATSGITCQALLNVFVVLGLAPLTGVPLPFISYGASNIIFALALVGILRGVDRNRNATPRRQRAPVRATSRARPTQPLRRAG